MGRPKKTPEERMKYFKEKNTCKSKCIEESTTDAIIAGLTLVAVIAVIIVIFSVI